MRDVAKHAEQTYAVAARVKIIAAPRAVVSAEARAAKYSSGDKQIRACMQRVQIEQQLRYPYYIP